MAAEAKLRREDLTKFSVFNNLSDHMLSVILNRVELKHARPGENIITYRSNDSCAVFLVSGEIHVRTADNVSKLIKAGSPEADEAITHHCSRQSEVIAATTVDYIVVKPHWLLGTDAGGGLADKFSVDHKVLADPILCEFYQVLEADDLRLPALPAMLEKMLNVTIDTDAKKVKKIIENDPAAAAVLIKIANSPFYLRVQPTKTVEDALRVLGIIKAKSYIISYVYKSMFSSSSPVIKKQLQALWNHSADVASFALVLAKHYTELEPERAMLMGLLHDIGSLAIINHARESGMEDVDKIKAVLKAFHTVTGTMILKKWGFPGEFIEIPEKADRWDFDSDTAVDYGDVVMLAHLVSLRVNPADHCMFLLTEDAPALETLPISRRIGLDSESEETLSRIGREAAALKAETLQVLHA